MKISDYKPLFYKDNIEMNNIIYSEEEEFENGIKLDINNAFNNTFVKTANLDGIIAFEKLLNIPLDANSDDIEYRRSKIFSKLSSSGNLTMTWLKNNLNELIGQSNYQIYLYNNLYKLVINVSDLYANTANMVYNNYKNLIPANLIFEVYLIDTTKQYTYIAAIMNGADISYFNAEVI